MIKPNTIPSIVVVVYMPVRDLCIGLALQGMSLASAAVGAVGLSGASPWVVGTTLHFVLFETVGVCDDIPVVVFD
jgi:hypothetical protein